MNTLITRSLICATLLFVSILCRSTCIILFCLNDTTIYIAMDSRGIIKSKNMPDSISDSDCKIYKTSNCFVSLIGNVSAPPIYSNLYGAIDILNSDVNPKSGIRSLRHNYENKLNKLLDIYKTDSQLKPLKDTLLQLVIISQYKDTLTVYAYDFITQTNFTNVKSFYQKFSIDAPYFRFFGSSYYAGEKIKYFQNHPEISKKLAIEDILVNAINYQSLKTNNYEVGGHVSIVKIKPHTFKWIR